MSKVFVLVGQTASGKTTIFQKLQHQLHNVIGVVAYTTRDKRQNEINGYDYNFITEKYMKCLNEMNELDCVKTFVDANERKLTYALPTLEKEADINKILIIDPDGFRKLKEKYGDLIVSIYLQRDYESRYESLLSRGDDTKEIKRRLESDLADFEGIVAACDYVVTNDFTEKPVKQIKEYINKVIQNERN